MSTVWAWSWKLVVAFVALVVMWRVLRFIVRGVITWMRRSQGLRLASCATQLVILRPSHWRYQRSWVEDEIKSFPGSVLVWEVGDTLYQQTWEHRHIYRGLVSRFEPASASSAACDMLGYDFISLMSAEAVGQVQRLVTALVAPQGLQKLDPVQAAAVPVLTSIILHCRGRGSGFPGVLAWMCDPSTSLSAKIQELDESYDPIVASGAHHIRDLNESFRAIVWQTALAPLIVCHDPIVAANLKHNDFLLSSIVNGITPHSLYCCVRREDLDRLGGLCTTLLERCVAEVEYPMDWGGKPTGERRHAVMLVVDPRMHQGGQAAIERAMASLHSERSHLMTWIMAPPRRHVPSPSVPVSSTADAEQMEES